MQVGDLISIKGFHPTKSKTICIVLHVSEKATLVYNSLSQQEEWVNNFIWRPYLEVICENSV